MKEYTIRIVGSHYAANPDIATGMAETEDMHRRTVALLSELDEKRPLVVLMPDTANPVNPQAVMARVMGRRIGFVANDELPVVQPLMQDGRPLKAEIQEVNVKKHGWLTVRVEADEALSKRPTPETNQWEEWKCPLPVLTPTEALSTQLEAEFMIDALCPSDINEADAELLTGYLEIWINSCLHDLSRETREMRDRYIEQLKPAAHPALQSLCERLEKQRTAVCGAKRMRIRTEVWWKELLASDAANRLLTRWQMTEGFRPAEALQEVEEHLRRLPGGIYEHATEMDKLFSAIYYQDVPRTTLWSIYSLLLLRDLSRKESLLPAEIKSNSTDKITELAADASLPSNNFELLVTKPAKAKEVVAMLHEYVDRQTQPKEILKPIRAAMDAGIISRPTWGQFCAEFGEKCLKQKSSLSHYTGTYEYNGADFKLLVEAFKKI